jgi:GNAT superfamily N-acetyltransferase
MASDGCTARVLTDVGIPLEVRPIAPSDRARLAEAFEKLSERARRQRFLGAKPRLSAVELTYLTDVDHREHEALAAIDPSDGSLVAIARYATPPGESGTADMAITVLDAWHGQGIGRILGSMLVDCAAANGIARLTATTFEDNRPARSLLRRLGFRTVGLGTGVIELESTLPAS